MIDFDHAWLLLNVIEHAGRHGLQFKVLADEARAELTNMLDEHTGKAKLQPADPAETPIAATGLEETPPSDGSEPSPTANVPRRL